MLSFLEMSDEDHVQDGAALSDITSKMPTPPPRPTSLASSTRSSKRSSVASSQFKQSKHLSANPTEVDHHGTPPTPSLHSFYTNMSLGEELAQSPQPSFYHSPQLDVRRPSSSPGYLRTPRSRTSSMNVASVPGKRRSSRAARDKERDKEIIATGLGVSPPSASTIQSIDANLSASATCGNGHMLEREFRLLPDADLTRSEHVMKAALLFGEELSAALWMLFSLVLWPACRRVASTLVPKEDELTVEDNAVKRSAPPQTTESDSLRFAESFKHVLCSSHLLTSSLTISRYDQPSMLPAPESVKRGEESSQGPLSVAKPLRVWSTDYGSGPNNNVEWAQTILFNATAIAVALLIPLCRDQRVWMRSSILLISLTWAVVIALGTDNSNSMEYEVSHQPDGTFSLLDYDNRRFADENARGPYLSSLQGTDLADKMCDLARNLVKSFQSFDIECNKSIALIQEVELVSRGYKLSHPFPPISRIEANDSLSSPSRAKPNTWTSTATTAAIAPSMISPVSRLSRSSSSGGSTSSGWKHHGSQSQSLLLNSSASGRNSPQQQVDVEVVRLSALRIGLLATFDEGRSELERALQELKPLVDQKELSLLEDIYDVANKNQDDSAADRTPEPLSAPPMMSSALTDHRTGWSTSTARPRKDAEATTWSGDDSVDRPSTPQRFAPLHDGIHGSSAFARRRDSGMSEAWSVASPTRDSQPLRGGSRLGYVTDRAPASSSTPNQSAASKRLSYVSSTASTASPLQTKALHYHQTSPSLGGSHGNWKRASLLNTGLLDDSRAKSTPVSQVRTPQPYLIASLKTSFEGVHTLRRKVICHLLALDITLKRRVTLSVKGGESLTRSSREYWTLVEKVVLKLKTGMSRLAAASKMSLEKEMDLTSTINTVPNDSDDASLAQKATQAQDYTGMQDRLSAMGQSLRSIQVKMRACAEELSFQLPVELHGTTGEGYEAVAAKREKSERTGKSEAILETVREDLLTLSAEWESALKILRMQRATTPTSAVGDTTSSTLNTSRLDSPQEAEEDALRQWISQRGGDVKDTTDSEDERTARRILDSGILQWSALDEEEDEEKEAKSRVDIADLSELLVKSASPDHLPRPGLEQVYESLSQAAERKMQRSTMSREERIRVAKEQRAAADQKAMLVEGFEGSTHKDPTTGMIQELQAVMKSRKSQGISEERKQQEPHSQPQPQQTVTAAPSQAAFAF